MEWSDADQAQKSLGGISLAVRANFGWKQILLWAALSAKGFLLFVYC